MNNRFYFSDNDDSTSQLSSHNQDQEAFYPEDDDAPLPFPKPIDRSSFASSEFDPTVFLSSLSNRFQTLEDLQEELRGLSQSLTKELVDLVNDNYQDFLNLGGTLSGGEERVEEIRVGLLGFQRDVSGLRSQVDERRQEVQTLIEQKRGLRREIGRGRVLLEIAERLDQLENDLKLTPKTQATNTADSSAIEAAEWSSEWDEMAVDESDEEHDDTIGTSKRLKDMVERYQILRLLMNKHDAQHPFLLSQRDRIAKVRDAIRTDIEAAFGQQEDPKIKKNVVQLRFLMDEL